MQTIKRKLRAFVLAFPLLALSIAFSTGGIVVFHVMYHIPQKIIDPCHESGMGEIKSYHIQKNHILKLVCSHRSEKYFKQPATIKPRDTGSRMDNM